MKAHEPDGADIQSSTEATAPPRPEQGAKPKIQSYPQARRPAGGMSRPLPSPGTPCPPPLFTMYILTIPSAMYCLFLLTNVLYVCFGQKRC